MAKFVGTDRVSVSAALSKELKRCLDTRTRTFANLTFYRYMIPYTPFVTGAMATTVNIQADGIHFEVPYAHRLYEGDDFKFSKELHPLAQARWGEVAANLHGDAISREIKFYISKTKL